MNVLYTELRNFLSDEVFSNYLHQLPFPLRVKIGNFQRWEDAQASLVGKILLKTGLKKYYGKRDNILEDLLYTKYNRPILPMHDIDFNISHSGQAVACALVKGGKVGVDIERVAPISLVELSEQFSNRELEMIECAVDPQRKLISYWAIKEAVVKAEGLGLNMPLKTIVISEDERVASVFSKKWFLQAIPTSRDYCGYAATDRKFEEGELQFEYVSFEMKQMSARDMFG